MIENKQPRRVFEMQVSARREKINVKITTKLFGDRVRVTLENDPEEIWDYQSVTASLLQSESRSITVMVPTLNPYKVVHEIVALMLSEDATDKKLMTLKNPPYDPKEVVYLNMTPDFILDKPLRIFELGTTQAQTESSYHTSYKTKYSDTQQKLEGANIEAPIGIIIVGTIGVYSNVKFSSKEISCLCASFNLGQTVFHQICDQFSLKQADDPYSLDEKMERIEIALSNHDLPIKAEAPIISYEMIEQFRKESESIDLTELSRSIFRMSIKKASELRVDPISNYEECMKTLPQKARGSMKAAVQLPLISNMQHLELPRSIMFGAEGSYQRLWSSILMSGDAEQPSSVLSFESQSDGQWRTKSVRSFSKRLSYITGDDMRIFSEVGLFAKKFRNEQYLKEKKTESQKTFGMEDYTEDIQNFIDNFNSDADTGPSPITQDYFDLIMPQRDLNFSNEPIDHLKVFSKTQLGKYLHFVTLLAQELNLDIIKKLKKEEFIFKKIPGYSCWYLAKPTGSHLFYSLMVKGDLHLGMGFKEPIFSRSDTHIFEFVSTDRNRISTMLNCFETICTLKADIWSKYSDVSDPYEEIRSKKLKFATMMMLENKQTTADSIYNLRQMYMKISSGSPYSHPGSLLEKTEQLRSRFAVWVMKRTNFCFQQMLRIKPKRVVIDGEESDDNSNHISNDIFTGLIDIISGKEESKFENVIYTSYLACLHSYGTMSKMAAELKILSKVAKYELKMKDADRNRMGFNSYYGKHNVHEFNLEVSLLGGKQKRRMLENVYSQQTDRVIWDKFCKALQTGFLEFATFKASLKERSIFDAKVKQPSAVKAIEEVIHSLDLLSKAETTPYDNLIELFEFCFRPVQAKVDKKMDQAAGLREILTMNILSRYGIKVVEKMMELINIDSPSEILSKGFLKEQTLESFEREVSLMHEDGFVVCTVDMTIDHSKWCQYYVMPKFASHMYPVLPKTIHKFLCLILNAITQKKILMSDSMIAEMLKDHNYYDETISTVKNQFLGKEDPSIVQPFSIALKNESNMGQGWLQNLSGSDGDADMMIVTSIMEMVFNTCKMKRLISEKSSFKHFKIGSSDDQFQKMVFKVREEDLDYLKELIPNMSMIPAVVSHLSNKEMGMQKSEMMHVNKVGEFNQIFRSGNTMFVGTCKFVRAGMEIPVTTTIQDRSTNLSNTRRNMIENGCDMFTTSVAQLCQAHMHYRSLGMYSVGAFSEFKNLLLEKPHPSFGFFCQEPDNSIGSCGDAFARYHWIKRNPTASRISSALLRKIDMCLGVNGQMGPSISFRVTRTNKFHLFRSKFPDRQLEINENPEILYRPPRTRFETCLLLNSKARSADAELSFVYDMTPKVFQATAYFLTEPVLRVRGHMFDAVESLKVSIGHLISTLEPGELLSDNDLQSLFPHNQVYERLLSICPKFNSIRHYPCEDISRKRAFLRLDEFSQELDVPLIDCVREIWFGIRTNHNKNLIRESFSRFKEILPWLKDTHDDTMRAGGVMFENPESLKGVLESMKEKLSPVKFFSPIKQAPPEIMMLNLVKYNWKRHQKAHLDLPKTDRQESDIFFLANMSVGPYEEKEKLQFLKQVRVTESFNQIRDRNQRNVHIAKNVQDNVSPDIIFNKIRSMRGGMLSYFLVPQKWDGEKWKGDCIYMMNFSEGAVRFELSGTTGTLFVQKKSVIYLNRSQIFWELKRLGFDSYQVNSGMRLGQDGTITGSSGYGYRLDYNSGSRNFSWDPNQMRLSLQITENGQFKIKNLAVSRGSEVIYKFYIDARSLPLAPDMEIEEYRDFWKLNKKMDVNSLSILLEEYPEFTKKAFRMKLEHIFHMTVKYETEEIEDVNPFTEEMFADLLEKLDEEIEQLDVTMIDKPSEEGLDYSEFDFEAFAYQDNSADESELSALTILSTKIFDELLGSLLPMNLKAIYTSQYRVTLTDRPELRLFRKLTDYDRRPESKDRTISLLVPKELYEIRSELSFPVRIGKSSKLVINGEIYNLISTEPSDLLLEVIQILNNTQ